MFGNAVNGISFVDYVADLCADTAYSCNWIDWKAIDNYSSILGAGCPFAFTYKNAYVCMHRANSIIGRKSCLYLKRPPNEFRFTTFNRSIRVIWLSIVYVYGKHKLVFMQTRIGSYTVNIHTTQSLETKTNSLNLTVKWIEYKINSIVN